jgi:hypothetical protein
MGLLGLFESLNLFELTHLTKGSFVLATFILSFFLPSFLPSFLSDSEVPILRPNMRASFLFELWEHSDIK